MTGTIDAPTPEMAGERLYQTGYFPITITEKPASVSLNLSDLFKKFQKVKLEEIILFSQQLSTLYKAGLPLLTGLKSLTEQTENMKFKEVLGDIQREIEEGSTLHQAMSKYPNVFSTVYVNMIRAGETSGMLSESLDRFVTLADRELRTRQRVKEATRYPKIVIFSVVIAFVVLIAFVIPRFAQVFAQFKTPLPLPTRIMIGSNHIVHTYWYFILPIVVGIPLFLKHYFRTENGKSLRDKWKMRIPVLGHIFLTVALSRFAYIFVMLNRSGIPILQTLEITSKTLNNIHISQSIEEIGQKIREEEV